MGRRTRRQAHTQDSRGYDDTLNFSSKGYDRYDSHNNYNDYNGYNDYNSSYYDGGYQNYEYEYFNEELDDDGSPSKDRNILYTVLTWLLALASIGCLVYFGWDIYKKLNQTIVPTEVIENVLKDNDDGKRYIKLNWTKLKETYPEIKGWIYVPNSNINYPIVQHEGDKYGQYYLTHGAMMEPNEMGAIFLGPGGSIDFEDDNTMIYGHTVETLGGMFTGVAKFMNETHFEQNPYFYIFTPDYTYKAHIRLFAPTEDGSDYYLTSYGSWENSILDWQKQNAMNYRDAVSPKLGSHLVTLSTCDITQGMDTDNRFVLQGELEYCMEDVEYVDSDKSEFLKRFDDFLDDSVKNVDKGKNQDKK